MAQENSNGRAVPDAAFADRVLSALPSEVVPAALEARILADFDAVAARRRSSPWGAAARLVRRLRDMTWPGAPLWQPASIFALSLLVGLAAGALVPSADLSGADADQTAAQTVDTAPGLELSGDLR